MEQGIKAGLDGAPPATTSATVSMVTSLAGLCHS
ncbi:hypothetical protein L3Q82_017275, partial [Scortum barcoo]